MTTCLGKSCFPVSARAFRNLLSVYVLSYFPFGFKGRIWDLIVSVLDHCLSFYFTVIAWFYLLKMISKMAIIYVWQYISAIQLCGY